MNKIIPIFLLMLLANALTAQDENRKLTHIIDATYDSKSKLGYRFINRLDKTPILFAQIEPELLQKFNLGDDLLIGSTFEITYGTEKYYPEGKDAENSLPFKEALVILDLEQID